MSDLTPYEKSLTRHLNDLPLPDQDSAWRNMQKILDNDHNKGGGKKPPSSGNGNKLWGFSIGFIVLIACLLLIVHSHRNAEEKTSPADTNQNATPPNNNTPGETRKTAPVSGIGNTAPPTIQSFATTNNSAAGNDIKDARNSNTASSGTTTISNFVDTKKINSSPDIPKSNSAVANTSVSIDSPLTSGNHSMAENDKSIHNSRHSPEKRILHPFTHFNTHSNTANNEKADANTFKKGNRLTYTNKDQLVYNRPKHHHHPLLSVKPTVNSAGSQSALNDSAARKENDVADAIDPPNLKSTQHSSADQKNSLVKTNYKISTKHTHLLQGKNHIAYKHTVLNIAPTSTDENKTTDSSTDTYSTNISNTSTTNGRSSFKNNTRARSTAVKNPGSKRKTTTALWNNDVAANEPKNNGDVYSKNNGSFTATKRKRPAYHVKNSEQIGNEDNKQPAITPPVDSTERALQISPLPPTLFLLPGLAPSTVAPIAKNKSANKPFRWSIGIADQQPLNIIYTNPSEPIIPVSIADYIPSVDARLYHKNKWFIQTEVKVNAPQYIEYLTYKSSTQNLPFNLLTTAYTLQKMHDHQLLASFNYFIRPNWSIGTGIVYNLFAEADILQEVHKKMYGAATDSLIASQRLTNQDDSNFTSTMKNNFQLLFETEYRWKRFSIGANFAVGLTPYIKYTTTSFGSSSTLPAGQKENNSLDIFIRYELWRKKQ